MFLPLPSLHQGKGEWSLGRIVILKYLGVNINDQKKIILILMYFIRQPVSCRVFYMLSVVCINDSWNSLELFAVTASRNLLLILAVIAL